MVNDVFVHSKPEKSSSFSEQHSETLSFVGLKNSGNTCFLAASTNLVLSIREVAHLVSLMYHNSFCVRKHCLKYHVSLIHITKYKTQTANFVFSKH